MGKYRRQWFHNILVMQAIIVLAFTLICAVTPFEVIVDYIDETGGSTLRTLDEGMAESLEYAQQTIHFLARSDAMVSNLGVFADPDAPSEERNAAQTELRWQLLSTGYSNPEFEVVACITPDVLLTNLGVAYPEGLPSGRNRSMSKLLAQDAFAKYLASRGLDQAQNQYILLEEVGENTFLAAMLKYENVYSAVEEGVFVRSSDGRMLVTDGGEALNRWVLENQERLFESDSFGVPRYGLNLLGMLHVVDGELYVRSEYCALESGMRYIRMRSLSHLLKLLTVPAAKCAALCVLGEMVMALVLWRLTGRVLRPFNQLREAAARMDQGEESLLRINRLMESLRRKRLLQRQVLGVYALTLVPVLAMLPVSVSLLGAAVSDEVQSAYIDSVRQTAEVVANRMELYRRQNTAVTIDGTIRELILQAAQHTRDENDLRLEAQFLAHGLYRRGVLGGALYDSTGALLAGSRGYVDGEPLAPKAMQSLSGKYDFSILQTDAYGSDATVMICAIRATEPTADFRLYETMGYLLLETEPLLDFDADQGAESYYYLYSDEAWSFVETPDYLPFRFMLEGMAQSGLLNVNRPVDSRVVTLNAEMLRQEAYLPEFAEDGGGSRMLAVSAQVGNTGLALVSATSMLPITEVGRLLPLLLGFTLLVFGCAMLLVAMLFTQKLVRRVRAVESYLESLDLNRYELPDGVDASNEIGALAQAMRDSVERINGLKQAVVEEQANKSRMEVRKREAEVIALQSQMDSHLISNVFATMKLLLHEGEYETLRQVIDATGNFLRSGLTHNEYDVTLERELRHVKAYLEIQRIRFGDRLRVEWEDFDPRLTGCRVPKYLLQPVLENAIKHGMRPREQLTIRIHIACVKGDLSIRVSNDGYGLSAEAVEQLNRRLERREMADHIGLSNVQERIALRYGPPYGLALSSGEAGLTWVDVLLPMDDIEEV